MTWRPEVLRWDREGPQTVAFWREDGSLAVTAELRQAREEDRREAIRRLEGRRSCSVPIGGPGPSEALERLSRSYWRRVRRLLRRGPPRKECPGCFAAIFDRAAREGWCLDCKQDGTRERVLVGRGAP